MKTHFSLLLATLCGLASLAPLHTQTTAFTYQGRLTSGGGPANGSHDFQFTLFGTPSGGSPVEDTVSHSAVGVTNGVFTVSLDFGADVFSGQDRWLDIGVRPAGGGAFTPLSPRQPITPTPYALTALTALYAEKATTLANGAVSKLNNLSNNVTLAAGQNVTITPSGNTLTIGASGINPWGLSGSNAFYTTGSVGVGTTQPVSKLEIAAQDALTITGFQPFLTFRDSNAGLARNLIQSVSGGLNLFTERYLNGLDSSAFVRMDNAGRLGLGTATPVAKLDVRGDIRLGPNAEFRATSSEENLRIVRGVVDRQGNRVSGSGFTVFRAALGDYGITFTTPFAAPPVVTASYDVNGGNFPVHAMVDEVTAGSANVAIRYMYSDHGSFV